MIGPAPRSLGDDWSTAEDRTLSDTGVGRFDFGAVIEAHSKLWPAHIGGARGRGTINLNRRVRAEGGQPAAVGRNPEGFVDRELVVFRIDDARVGTVTCPTSRQPLCGSVAGRLHTAALPADATAVVLAQVDRG